MQFRNVTTLIFDFGGVIINLNMQRCINKFRELGFVDIDKYLNNFVQSGIFLQFEKGQINAEEFRAEIRKHIPAPLTDEQIDQAWCSFLVDIPDEKFDLLLELRKKFKVLLLSNTNPIHMAYADSLFIRHKGLPMSEYFDKRYLSYEMRAAKPDAEIFEKLLADAGVSPGECVFFDDGSKNIEQARKLGIQTYLVHEPEDLSFLLRTDTWLQD